jgi:lipopolysaccharide export system protein LptA
MRRVPPLLALFATIAAGSAFAQRHNTAAPIDFGADRIELQDRQDRVVLAGSVSVKQADMTLNASRMTVAYTGEVIGGNPQVSRLDASGGVTVRRPNQVARSQYAIYDLNRRIITMLGGVSLAQGSNNVNGARLTINLDTGRAVIDGSGVGGSSGAPGTTSVGSGRVTGTFSVPQRN